MLCVHRFVGLFHLDVSFLSKRSKGWSSAHLRFSWQKSAKSLVNFEKFILIETQPNWWKLPNPVLARGSFLPPKHLSTCPLHPETAGKILSQMDIAFGLAMEVIHVQTGAVWGVFRNLEIVPHKNHSRVLLDTSRNCGSYPPYLLELFSPHLGTVSPHLWPPMC